MGGLVKTVIKTQNGELLSAVINTDGISTLMWHRAFRAKDVEAIQPVLKFLDKDDLDGSFAPYEYGIIYVDWQADKIISCQGYTNLLNAYWDNLDRELEGHYSYGQAFPDNFKRTSLFQELLEDGIVEGVVCTTTSGRQVWKYGDKLEMKDTLKELLADIKALSQNGIAGERVTPVAFRYQLPFEVIVVEESDTTLRQQISDLSGHEFCSQDRYLFDKFHQANSSC